MRRPGRPQPGRRPPATPSTRRSAPAWSWLTWLPHTTSAHSPVHQRHLVSTIGDAVALVSSLEELLERRLSTKDSVPAVVVLVDDEAPVERSRLVELAERGPVT